MQPGRIPRRLRVTGLDGGGQAGGAAAERVAARDDLHAIVHLGDYFYEYGPGQYGYGPQDMYLGTRLGAAEAVEAGRRAGEAASHG